VKGKLNNDGQLFHKYQAIEHKNVHDIWRWKFHVLVWDRHNNAAGLKQLMRSQPVPKSKRIRLSVYRKEHKHAKIVCLFIVNGMISVNSLIVTA
jgi:hypothetical protein